MYSFLHCRAGHSIQFWGYARESPAAIHVGHKIARELYKKLLTTCS